MAGVSPAIFSRAADTAAATPHSPINRDAAFALTEQAMAAFPIDKEAFDGPINIEILARVAAQMGEPTTP